MGKPISSVGGVSSPTPAQTTTQVSGSGSEPTRSPAQSPTQSSKPEPVITLWPPAYGYRRSATEGNREAHNGWQEQWLKVGPGITRGAIDSVAGLKPLIDPLLVQPNGKPHRR